MSSWLVVTPARNEARHLPALARSLAEQTLPIVGLWVVVDDGSDDGTATCVDWATLPFPVHVIRRDGVSGLARGGAFASWYAGTDEGLRRLPQADRILKLDADVVLSPEYLARLAAAGREVGLVGGVIDQPGEQAERHHVRGALKAYNRAAFEVVRRLPPSAGHDVMDEVALRVASFEVRPIPEATVTVQRATTTSEGLLRGRVRNGKVSRWTGYHPVYLALRVARYAVRRPPLIGALALLWGYATAGRGPFAPGLRAAHRREQVGRLRTRLLQLRERPRRLDAEVRVP